MYITYKEKDYSCKCRIGQSMVYSGLPEDFPVPVEGEIVLKADDGFVLRTDKVEDYLYPKFEGGVLTLTNIPEPEPIEPEPIPEAETEPTEIERLRADIDFIAAMTGVNL